MKAPARFFATASRGTEEVLADELRELGLAVVEATRGGVAFGEGLEDAYRACLWSRVASRVLLPLDVFDADDADALYSGVHAIDWNEHIGADSTLAVDVAGKNASAGPGHFVALKTKDAIVDRIRESQGRRPDVDTARPDVRVNLHVARNRVTVNLDLSGRGLHRRGGGRAGAAAPLKENLAAAILRLAAWHERCGDQPFFDPMCGSGTLLVEAAWMALDVAPGLSRGRIGAEGWRGHDEPAWNRMLDEARERKRSAAGGETRIAGSDVAASAIEVVRQNLKRAGLSAKVRVERTDIRDVQAPWPQPGLLVTNPPYGERLGESGELGPLYELLGDVLRRRFPGWSAWVFTGNPALAKRIGLRPASRHLLFNGPIESRLLGIPISSTPVVRKDGPGWRRAGEEARGFANRLRKNLARLRPWAEREGLTCYRLYDAHVPEYNVAVDWYDGAVRVEEYAPPRKVSPADAERRLRDAVLVVSEVLEVEPSEVTLRVRRRRAPGEQHGRRGESRVVRTVQEGDLRFEVNLEDYLDTGLFLDDRLLRRRIHAGARGRDFLNLFAYTCASSVAAARGGARSTTSVDLSNTYLSWGRRNFELNDLALERNELIRADVLQWIRRAGRRKFDRILLAPPSHSRSRAMQGDFDIQRDHPELIERVRRLLAPRGQILFTTNLRTFDLVRPDGASIREITDDITPEDFAHRPRLRAWTIDR